MCFKWDCDWDEIRVGRSWFPGKKVSYSFKKRSLSWVSLALHLEKYPKHASQILLSYGRKMCALMKMAYIQVGPSRQWFTVWILPKCELVVLVKAVKSCLWRQDFPGCTEKNWFYWFLRLVLSAHMPPPHPFQVPCTSETQTEQVRFYLLKYFQKHWILVFQVTGLYYWESKDYLDNYCYLQKCSHSPNDLIFFSAVFVFFWKYGYIFKA